MRLQQRDLINRDGSALISCIPLPQDLLDTRGNQGESENVAEPPAGPEGARRRRAVPEAVRKQVQGCSGEKRRKGPRLPAPARSPGRVQRAPKCRGARAGDIEGLPSGHTHPEPRRLTERGQRASSSPVCNVECRAQTERLLRRLPAPRAPISPAGLAEHNP